VTQNWSFEVPKLGSDLDKSVAGFEVCFQPFHSAKIGAPILPVANKIKT